MSRTMLARSSLMLMATSSCSGFSMSSPPCSTMKCFSSLSATCASRGWTKSPSILRRLPGEAGRTGLAAQVEGPALVGGDALPGAAEDVHFVVDDCGRVAVAGCRGWRFGFGGQVAVPGSGAPGLEVEDVDGLAVGVVVAREVASEEVQVVAVEARAVAPALRRLVRRPLAAFYLLLVHFPKHLVLVRGGQRGRCCGFWFRLFQFHNNYKIFPLAA